MKPKIEIALPCISFSVKEREIISKYNLMTFPEFLDNHYVKKKQSDVLWLMKNINKFGKKVKFAIAPDYKYEFMLDLKKKYPFINWIFPFHQKSELKYTEKFEWIGFPHRAEFRDYSIEWYFENTKGKKHWYLGFWDESSPYLIQRFDGIDTTIPETYSGKYGKLWYNFGKSEQARNMKTIKIFEHNVIQFKKAIIKIMKQSTVC